MTTRSRGTRTTADGSVLHGAHDQHAADGANSVFAADVDGDGDTGRAQRVVNNDDKIAWYENDGSQTSRPTAISTGPMAAHERVRGGRGRRRRLDVLSASWYDTRSPGTRTTAGTSRPPTLIITAAALLIPCGRCLRRTWTATATPGRTSPRRLDDDGSPGTRTTAAELHGTISTIARRPHSVFAADVDGDGDMDVLSASRLNDDKIAWYENDGSRTSRAQHDHHRRSRWGNFRCLRRTWTGRRHGRALRVPGDDKIAWYENDGEPASHRTPSPRRGALLGVCGGRGRGRRPGRAPRPVLDNKIAWYENDGSAATSWPQHDHHGGRAERTSVFAADVDGDGDMDVLRVVQ